MDNDGGGRLIIIIIYGVSLIFIKKSIYLISYKTQHDH